MHPVDRRLRNTLFIRLQKKEKNCPRLPGLYLSLAAPPGGDTKRFGGSNFRQTTCVAPGASRSGSVCAWVQLGWKV
jgi:hypothetical protein